MKHLNRGRLSLFATTAVLIGHAHPVAAQMQDAAQHIVTDTDIIVTAQRRSENIQNVPISITALSAQTLENTGIQDSRDLPMVTPGLRIDSVGAYVQPTIRGITTTLTSGPEANIATYLDGVYRPDTFGAIYDLPDVQQIEILKGPQGTLFGRNATGGAILITTKKPDIQNVTGKLSAGYSSFDTINLNGFASAPIVRDKLAISLAASYENIGDGWKTNLLTGKRKGAGIETGLVRGKIRFLPWEGADFTLTGLYSWRNDNSAYNPSIWRGNSDLANVPGVVIAARPWTYALDTQSAHDSRATDISLRGDIELGRGTLTTTTAYTKSWADLIFDADNAANVGTFATTDTDYSSFMQELIYATDQLGSFRAVGGLFFFSSESNTQPYYVGASGFQLWFKDKGTSYAAFGELTYDISDRLSLTGGLRYSHEKRRGLAAIKIGPPPFSSPTLNQIGEKSWDSVTPRLSLMFAATDDTNLYATYSQGFKSGLFNTPGFQAEPVDPEKVKAYEIGIKSKIMPSLRINAAAFHYDYKDLQVPTLENLNNVLIQRIFNAASAKIWGSEINVDWQMTDSFSLSTGISYLDAKYNKFPGASVNIPVSQLPPPGNAQCTEAVKPTSGLCNILANVSGNRMIRSPKWSGSVTASYARTFDAGQLNLSTTIYASSEIFYEFGNRVRQPGYAKINASANWQFNNGVKLGLWGRNLTDKAVLTSLVGSSSYDAVDYERPREYGVTVGYQF